jgi:hypothetical protein
LYQSFLGGSILCDQITFATTTGALVSAVTPKITNNIGIILTNISATSLRITFPSTISLGSFIIVAYYNATVDQAANGFTAVTNLVNLQSASILTGAINNGTTGVRAPAGTSPVSRDNIQWLQVQVNAPGNQIASIDLNIVSASGGTSVSNRLGVYQIPYTSFP